MSTTAPATAIAITHFENERVIVTEWRFPPGTATGHHVHGHDYVVVPLTDGTLRISSAEGSTDVPLTLGAAYGRPAGVAHNVANAGDSEFRFVEIELKR